MKPATRKLGKRWWVTGFKDVPPMGPYDTKGEAEEARKGVSRFFCNQDKPGYVTCDKISRS